MALPAGYSSDEDDFDGFGDEDTRIRNKSNHSVPGIEDKSRQIDELYLAIINGSLEVVESALSKGWDPNVPLQDNWSPLMLSASVGNLAISKLLIDHKADVNCDKEKYTVLMAACSCQKLTDGFEVVKLLVEKGADVQKITRKRINALMFAANSGNVKAVKFLLPLSNKSAADNQGWTALFWAVNNNKIDVVKLLLEEGFNDLLVDVRNNTVLSYAIAKDFHEIAEILPSNKQSEEITATPLNTTIFYDSFIEHAKPGKRPRFFANVHNFLYGVKSESIIPKFVENNLGLFDLLSITDEELQQIGIAMPYQRYRVLSGLHRFHKLPFSKKSIPIINKDEIYSNVDALQSIIAAVQQITTMEASIKYISTNLPIEIQENKELKTLDNNIRDIKARVAELKRVSRTLQRRTKYWNYLIRPVDLIVKDTKTCRTNYRKKLFLVGSVGLILYVGFRYFKS